MTPGRVRFRETLLERTRTSSVSRSRLKMGWELVLLYLSQIQMCAEEIFTNTDLANQVLADFVEFAKTCGWRIWRVRYAILSVQHNHKSLKRHLPRPWEALQSWQLTLPIKDSSTN